MYLRVADMVEENDFNYSQFKHISDELYDFLNRYEIFENDLIISIAGTVGKIALIKKYSFKEEDNFNRKLC
ncbi:MAG: hypothetical protein R2766_05805 [Saprospiraceae bacterium]